MRLAKSRVCPRCQKSFPKIGGYWRGNYCVECERARQREYRRNHPKTREQVRQAVARHSAPYKDGALRAYSGDDPRCACCGERERLFLTIDHIEGDGAAHRREIGVRGGLDFYKWLKANDYPPGFQVLCLNCNFAKGTGFLCPHEVARRGLTGRVRISDSRVR